MVTGEPAGADLVARACRGDEDAIADLYRLHQPALERYLRARALGRARSEVDDLAQQAWLDALRNVRRFKGDDAAWRPWLFTIARRRLIDLLRRQQRRPEELSDAGEVTSAEMASSAADEAEALESGLAAARRIAELLPPDQADVVLLRVVAGLDVEQVAAVIGKRPGNVRVLQHRGLQRLAERFDGGPDDEM